MLSRKPKSTRGVHFKLTGDFIEPDHEIRVFWPDEVRETDPHDRHRVVVGLTVSAVIEAIKDATDIALRMVDAPRFLQTELGIFSV
jgi:hypothetical protein